MAALGVAPGTGAAPGQPAARGRAIRLVRPAVEREPDQAGLEYREFARALRSLPAGPSLTLRRSRRTVWAHGIARTLTARQFELLTYLISVNGAVVSRADLFAAISAGEAPAAGSRTVDMHIARIRERLSLPGVIITVRGRGYRFNSSIPVTHI
jgi:DNA-binding response OmpR family regulator